MRMAQVYTIGARTAVRDSADRRPVRRAAARREKTPPERGLNLDQLHAPPEEAQDQQHDQDDDDDPEDPSNGKRDGDHDDLLDLGRNCASAVYPHVRIAMPTVIQLADALPAPEPQERQSWSRFGSLVGA